MPDEFTYEITCLLTAENALAGPSSVDLEGVFVRARARRRVAFAIYVECRCRSTKEFDLQFQLEGPASAKWSEVHLLKPSLQLMPVAFNDVTWGMMSAGAYALHAFTNGKLAATRTFVLE
ncbi:MAG: hypothetical protein IT462_09150 [Planctomycetes bacterium]|nr:hypothetical protein [Planctomycetota bacterium]